MAGPNVRRPPGVSVNEVRESRLFDKIISIPETKKQNKQTRSKVNDERARHRSPFAPPLTFTHALKKKKKVWEGE